MIDGDPGAESVFLWTTDTKNVDRRGAGPDRCVDLRAWRRRRVRASTSAPARSSCEAPNRAMCSKCGSSMFSRAVCAQSCIRRPRVRQQRGRLVGVPLQRSSDRAETARSHHDLRDRRDRRPQLGACGLQLPLDRLRPIPSGVMHRIIDYPGVPVDHALIEENYGLLEGVRIPMRPHFGVIARGAARGGVRRFHPSQLLRRQYRQLADRQRRNASTTRSRSPGRSSRSAIRMPPKEIRSCAAPRSNVR